MFSDPVQEKNVRKEAQCEIYCSTTLKDLRVKFIGLLV